MLTPIWHLNHLQLRPSPRDDPSQTISLTHQQHCEFSNNLLSEYDHSQCLSTSSLYSWESGSGNRGQALQ